MEFLRHFDVTQWVSTIGYLGLFLVVLFEMGFFFGFFLPGDSLVFAAGLLASKGTFDIKILVPLFIFTAFLGYVIGYWFGKKLEKWIIRKKDSFWFKKKYLIRAQKFYEKHGGIALILGRLLPIIRTFVPIAAGIGEMKYSRFVIFNMVSAVIWGGCITMIGYLIGGIVPNAAQYILYLVLGIIFISICPAICKFFKEFLKQWKIKRNKNLS